MEGTVVRIDCPGDKYHGVEGTVVGDIFDADGEPAIKVWTYAPPEEQKVLYVRLRSLIYV